MPASITLSSVCLSTPDGRPLFTDLDLALAAERVGLVGRNGVGKTTLMRLITGELTPRAGSVSVSGTLGVLRQTVQEAPEASLADLFGATAALALLARAAAGLADAEELAAADWTIEERLAAALARVGLGVTPDTPLARLSGGEASRARLAALIFQAPDFLLLDEPTNNLDRAGRRAVADLLAGWRGGALVISHDRELLETMDAIVEMTALGASRYGGAFSDYQARKALELAAAAHDVAEADKRLAVVRRSAQAAVERQARRDGAGVRKRERGDMPRILMNARRDRAEDSGGGNARLADIRRAEAEAAAAAARRRIEVLDPFAVTLAPTGLPAGRVVLSLRGVATGYAPDAPVVSGLSFDIVGPERVAIVGPNGSGKTTLLRAIAGDLAPLAGTVERFVDMALFDQRVGLIDPRQSVLDNFRRLNPTAPDNLCRAALARFRFRAEAALQRAGDLSGGELLRAGLACVLGGPHPPQLLVLDEPTNHLDLAAIAAVEAGLAAYDGALLVVSHDETFLAAIGIGRRVELAVPRTG